MRSRGIAGVDDVGSLGQGRPEEIVAEANSDRVLELVMMISWPESNEAKANFIC